MGSPGTRGKKDIIKMAAYLLFLLFYFHITLYISLCTYVSMPAPLNKVWMLPRFFQF